MAVAGSTSTHAKGEDVARAHGKLTTGAAPTAANVVLMIGVGTLLTAALFTVCRATHRARTGEHTQHHLLHPTGTLSGEDDDVFDGYLSDGADGEVQAPRALEMVARRRPTDATPPDSTRMAVINSMLG